MHRGSTINLIYIGFSPSKFTHPPPGKTWGSLRRNAVLRLKEKLYPKQLHNQTAFLKERNMTQKRLRWEKRF